jgi:hypothetical protein
METEISMTARTAARDTTGSALAPLLVMGLAFIWLLALVYLLSPKEQANTNYLIVLLGSLLGWVLGLFFSPYDDKEAKAFVSIGQAVSAFISGYVFSKLDRFVEASLFVAQGPVYGSWIRVGLFVAAAVIWAVLVFSSRAYFDLSKLEDQKATNPGPEG